MNKILKVVGLVVLALAVLLALVIVFVPINGYTILQRIQVARERDKPLSPNYTATRYSFDVFTGAIESHRASSLVDIKVNGSDQPIKVTPPASYTLSWTMDSSLLNNPGVHCVITGFDETGASVVKDITGPGEWKIVGAAFTNDRVPIVGDALTNDAPDAIDSYTIEGVTGSESNPTLEIDEVEVGFFEPTGQ